MNSKLPTLEDFKSKAKVLKEIKQIDKISTAQHELSKLYGYKNFNTIRPLLKENNSAFNKLPKSMTYYTATDGSIVNAQGLYRTADGYRTSADKTDDKIPKDEIERALIFIDHILIKRKTVNWRGSGSYGLKHHAERYLRHYKIYKNERDIGYVSNAALIIALDLRGFKLAVHEREYDFSLNISTNYTTEEYLVDDTLRNGQQNRCFYNAMINQKYIPFKDEILLNSNIPIENKNMLSRNHKIFLNELFDGLNEDMNYYSFSLIDKKKTKEFFQPLIDEGIVTKLSIHKSYGYSPKIFSYTGYILCNINLKLKKNRDFLFTIIDEPNLIEIISTIE